MSASLSRRVARLEQDASYRGELQLILIRGGLPTESGRAEAEIGGNVLVHEIGEDLDDFKARVASKARLVGAKFAVIHGLPPRGMPNEEDHLR